MISLYKHLNESLLDDEEELVNNNDMESFIKDWAEKTDLNQVNRAVSKFGREFKIEKNGKITVGSLRPKFNTIITMKELFPEWIEFKNIKTCTIDFREISDIYDKNSYKYIPDCIDNLFILFSDNNETKEISLEKLNASESSNIVIDIFKGNPDINFSQNNKYKHIVIKPDKFTNALNLESINDLKCDELVIFGNIIDSKGNEYIKDMSIKTSNNPYMDQGKDFKSIYNKFMSKNKVGTLYVSKYNNSMYKVVQDDNSFKLEKTK